jgi:mRNA interferase RelE/StbE
MAYNVIWNEGVIDELKEMDRKVASRIVNKVENHLVKSPADLGMALRGQFAGLYRYRVGKWRVIYSIEPRTETILVLRVEHRNKVYE